VTRDKDRNEMELKAEESKQHLENNFESKVTVAKGNQPKRIKTEKEIDASRPEDDADSNLDSDDEVTDLCEIEAILAHRVQRSTKEIQYLVKWRGIRHDANEWKSISELSAPETVEEYNFEHGIRLED